MYLIGVAILLVTVFVLITQNKTFDDDEIVEFLFTHILGVLISLTSWVGLAILAIYYLAKYISNKIKPKGN